MYIQYHSYTLLCMAYFKVPSTYILDSYIVYIAVPQTKVVSSSANQLHYPDTIDTTTSDSRLDDSVEEEALVIASGGQRRRQPVKKRVGRGDEEHEVSEDEEEEKEYEEGDFGKCSIANHTYYYESIYYYTMCISLNNMYILHDTVHHSHKLIKCTVKEFNCILLSLSLEFWSANKIVCSCSA